MTMCITFEMILSVMPQNPGISFGVTTIALFCGIAPVFFVHPGKNANIIMILSFSLICAVLLLVTCSNKTKNKKNCTEQNSLTQKISAVFVNTKAAEIFLFYFPFKHIFQKILFIQSFPVPFYIISVDPSVMIVVITVIAVKICPVFT